MLGCSGEGQLGAGWARAERAGGRAERAAGRVGVGAQWARRRAGKRQALGASGRAAGERGARGRQASGARGARGGRQARWARQQARARVERAGQGWLGAGRAGWPWAVHSVHSACFWPSSTRYFPESNFFWTLFVNPVHEHCSSRNFSKKKKYLKKKKLKNQIKFDKIFEK